MAASDAELNKLAKKLLDALAAQSSMVGSGPQTMGGTAASRLGRGGDSNGVGSQFNTAKDALRESSNAADKALRKMGKSSDMLMDSFKKVTKFNYIFSDTLKETTAKILDSHKRQTAVTEKITKATHAAVAAQGINDKSLRKAAARNFAYADAMNKMVVLSKRLQVIEEAKIEQTRLEFEVNKKSNRAKKTQLEAELAAIKAITGSENDIKKAMSETETQLKEMGKSILNNNIAFADLTATTTKTIKSGNILTLSQRKQDQVLKELRENSEDYAETLRQLNKESEKQHDILKDKMNKVMESMAGSMKALGGSVGGIIDNFREQLKYNVRESNYGTSLRTGMSDGQMSKFLGSNADTIRGMTGGANLNTFANGDLTALHQSVVQNYGESGLDGANRVAQLANIMQASGTNIRGNPGAVQDRISSYSNMSARLGMSKGDLTDIMSGMAQSGDLTQMSQKYAGMDPRAAQMALDKELEARIANAKMLGYSTDQIKQQIAMQKDKQFGNVGDQIRKIVGLKMMDNKMKRDGQGMTSSEMDAMRADAMGANLTAEQQTTVNRVKNRNMDAMNTQRQDAIARFGATGDYGGSGLARATVERQMLQSVAGGSGFGFSDEEQKDRMARKAIAEGRYGGDATAYLQGGGLSSQLTGPGISPGGVNSSLMPFDQELNAARTIVDGANQNPLISATKGIWATAINTGIMALQMGKMGGGGLLGKGKGGGIRAAVSGGVGRLAGVGGAMGAGKLGIASTGGRALMGGLGGLGVGILGAGLSWGGDKVKEQAAAEGLNNNTVFDKDTGGALMDTAGQAVSGAAMGALIGSFIPVLGTAVGGAIGGVIGAGKGAWENRDTLMRNYDTMFGENGTSPSNTLNSATAAAQKEREENAKPQQVELVGKSAEDLARTADHTSSTADATKVAATEASKANEYSKSRDDIRGALDALKTNQRATTDRYSDPSDNA